MYLLFELLERQSNILGLSISINSMQSSDSATGGSIADQIMQSVENVSKKGSFQLKITVFFLLVSFFTALQSFSSNLYYMNPVFSCRGFQGKVAEDTACEMLTFCELINKSTITSELEIYCDSRKHERTLIQTAMGFGNWFGIIFAGSFSDRKGRKFCFCLAAVLLNLTCLFQFIGVFYRQTYLLMISEFISGFSNKILYMSCLVLLTRFLSKKAYRIATLGWFISGCGLAQIAIAVVNEYFNNWRILYCIYTVGLCACSIASFYILLEDPIFLFDMGRVEEAKRVIEQIGDENRVSFEENQENLKVLDRLFEARMHQVERNLDDRNNNKFDLREMLNCDMVSRVLIIGILGCFHSMAIKSTEMSIQALAYSYNFNLIIVAFSNIFDFMSAGYIISIEPKRKRGFLVTSAIYGVIAMLLAFPFCYSNGNVESFVIFFLRFFICWIGNLYVRLEVDSFPEKYQLTAISAVEFLANFGNVLGPIFIQLSVDHSINPIFSVNLLRLTLGTLPLLCFVEQKIDLNSDKQDQLTPLTKD